MSLKRHFSLLVLLAISNPAIAQHHPAPRAGGQPHGGAVRPGQQGGRQQQMTPQQHEYMLHQQMMNEQLMFEEMMRSRGGAYKRPGGTNSAGGGKQPTGNNRPQPNANRQKNAPSSAKPGVKQQSEKRAESPGNVGKQTTQERAKEAKDREAAISKKRKEEENSIRRNEAKKANVANSRPLATDQSSISLLKTAEMKLRRADHDYAGHRVEAMRHVARALEHLTGSSAFNNRGVSSAGNLPQAESDRLLREAEGHLRTIENTLSTRTNSLAHHQNARTSVAEAIRELHIALRIN